MLKETDPVFLCVSIALLQVLCTALLSFALNTRVGMSHSLISSVSYEAFISLFFHSLERKSKCDTRSTKPVLFVRWHSLHCKKKIETLTLEAQFLFFVFFLHRATINKKLNVYVWSIYYYLMFLVKNCCQLTWKPFN